MGVRAPSEEPRPGCKILANFQSTFSKTHFKMAPSIFRVTLPFLNALIDNLTLAQ